MSILSGLFSASKSRDELALVFDVGSSSVGGALFRLQENGVPKIVFSVREPIALEAKIDFDRLLSLTAKSLEAVAGKISAAGLGAPTKTFCVLASPWYASQARTVRLEKNTPFTFNSKLADSLIQKEISIFKEEYMAEYEGTGSQTRLIELKNMKTMLNGYATSNPLNQKAKELEMKIFISMSPEQVLQSMEEAIGRHFNSEAIKFVSFPLASFTVARDMFVHQENFLLVDVGGELTDISIARKNSLCESSSFPIGLNFIIRGIASTQGCNLDEAKSFFSLYKEGHMEDGAKKRLEPVIINLKKEWLRHFQESLANLSSDISLPSVIFLTVDQDLAEFFTEVIKTEQFNQYTLTESKFKVVFLGSQALHGIAVFEGDVIRDPFIIIEAIYINRFFL